MYNHLFLRALYAGDCGCSNKPARVLLVATHPDVSSVSCRKNVVGEYASQDADRLVGKILSEFGNVFNIHAHAFIIDANAAASSPSMKSFKAALSDFKTEIIDVRAIYSFKDVFIFLYFSLYYHCYLHYANVNWHAYKIIFASSEYLEKVE